MKIIKRKNKVNNNIKVSTIGFLYKKQHSLIEIHILKRDYVVIT